MPIASKLLLIHASAAFISNCSNVTIAFMTLALAQVFHAFNARSKTRSALSALFTNPWLWGAVVLCVLLQVAAVHVPVLQQALRTVPPSARDWGLIGVAALVPVVVVEVVKAAMRTSRTGERGDGLVQPSSASSSTAVP
jgi:Ca2+-transporting ATPase